METVHDLIDEVEGGATLGPHDEHFHLKERDAERLREAWNEDAPLGDLCGAASHMIASGLDADTAVSIELAAARVAYN